MVVVVNGSRTIQRAFASVFGGHFTFMNIALIKEEEYYTYSLRARAIL
jgi:hypothetical protein